MPETDADSAGMALGQPTQLTDSRAVSGRSGTRSGRKLTLGRIVDAGIDLAAADGVPGVSMARLAARLGSGTMSIYRHVSSRDELIALMVDHALGNPRRQPPGATWRAAITGWAEQLRAVYRRHPWVLQVPISGPPLLPHDLLHLEAALEALSDTTLSEHDKLSVVLLISGFVRNDASLLQFVSPPGAPATMPSYGALLTSRLNPAKFPRLQRTLQSGALEVDDIDAEFHFGLNRIMDGLDVLITATKRPKLP